MTPINEIWIILDGVFALDYAQQLSIMAHAGTPDNAKSVGTALAEHHRKPLRRFDIAAGRMLEVEVLYP